MNIIWNWVQTDKIYITAENRRYLKEKGIRHTGELLGRKPKTKLDKKERNRKRK